MAIEGFDYKGFAENMSEQAICLVIWKNIIFIKRQAIYL